MRASRSAASSSLIFRARPDASRRVAVVVAHGLDAEHLEQ